MQASFLCFHWRGSQLTPGSQLLSQSGVFLCHFDPLSFIAFKDYYVSPDFTKHKQYFWLKAVLQKEVEAFLCVDKIYMFFSVTFQNGRSNLWA